MLFKYINNSYIWVKSNFHLKSLNFKEFVITKVVVLVKWSNFTFDFSTYKFQEKI